MSALTFRLRSTPPERLDLSMLTPRGVDGLAPGEIERIAINTGRLPIVVGDLFDVSGSGESIVIAGGSERLDGVGAGLEGGSIIVEGDVGQRCGFGMSDGSLTIRGSAGPFAATGATGGSVRISGDAGDQAGGAVHGAMHGLNGATLIIGGKAGVRLGDRMRRGLILVGGSAGDHAGCRMISGTIVADAVGNLPGYGMRRGSLLVRRHGRISPSFVETGPNRLVILPMIRRAVATLDHRLAEGWPEAPRRLAGDMASLGKGEILMLSDST